VDSAATEQLAEYEKKKEIFLAKEREGNFFQPGK
jgi:hypothetical protein